MVSIESEIVSCKALAAGFASVFSREHRRLAPNGTYFAIKVAVTLRVTNAKGHVLRPASLGETEKKLNFPFPMGVILVKPTDNRRS